MPANLIMPNTKIASQDSTNQTLATMVWFMPQALGVGSPFGANLSYIFKIRLTLLRDMGAAVSPFNAWLLAQGLETLSLRMERHVSNAKTLATWLEKQPQVEKVNYASLPSSPWHKLATKYAQLVRVQSSPLKSKVESKPVRSL